MVMTLPHAALSSASVKTQRSVQPSWPHDDLLPWADPYIQTLSLAHERAVQSAAYDSLTSRIAK